MAARSGNRKIHGFLSLFCILPFPIVIMKYYSCLLYFFLLLFLISCSSIKTEGPDLNAAITGHWLIIYPDHQPGTRSEREIYGKYQDSLVKLFGLKLVSFHPDGSFSEIDSLAGKGRWRVSADSTVEVRNGGPGFHHFISKYEDFEKDTLLLTEYIPLEKRPVKVVWTLKKISAEDEGFQLFQQEANTWRKQSSQPESEQQIRKRLSEMLEYYNEYFKLVSLESAYILPLRVPLPFSYYQHAIRVKDELSPHFVSIFYDSTDASKAHEILKETVTNTGDYFPRKKDFVLEYASYMELLSQKIASRK